MDKNEAPELAVVVSSLLPVVVLGCGWRFPDFLWADLGAAIGASVGGGSGVMQKETSASSVEGIPQQCQCLPST